MSVHVGMKSANMLSCGSQRAEASSPIYGMYNRRGLAVYFKVMLLPYQKKWTL